MFKNRIATIIFASLFMGIVGTWALALLPLWAALVIGGSSPIIIGAAWRENKNILMRRTLRTFLFVVSICLAIAAYTDFLSMVEHTKYDWWTPLEFSAVLGVLSIGVFHFLHAYLEKKESASAIRIDRKNLGPMRMAAIALGKFGMRSLYQMPPDRQLIYMLSLLAIVFSLTLATYSYQMSLMDIIILWSGVLAGVVVLDILRVGEIYEKSAAEQELRVAHDMQMGLMPKEDPVLKGFEIAAACLPANEVGGDFYDYVWLDRKKTKLGIAVADVSGKAMKAAMTAVMTSGMLYSEVQKSSSPREVLRRMNQPLYIRSDRRVFTAMAFAVIHTKDKRLAYSSAGQTPPILLRKGKAQELKIRGVRLPLGLKDDLRYSEANIRLQKGDLLAIFTDGIVEAMNMKQEMYGFERLQAALETWHDLSAAAVKDRILEDVKEFAGGAAQHDDMTIVVVKVV